MLNPLSPLHFSLFPSRQFTKNIFTFKSKNSKWNPIHLILKISLVLSHQLTISIFRTKYLWWNLIHLTLNLPLRLSSPIFSPSYYQFPHLLINRKTQKTVSVWKRTKYHTSKSELRGWFIHLSTYFYHTVRFTTIYHFNIYIYIYIYPKMSWKWFNMRKYKRFHANLN